MNTIGELVLNPNLSLKNKIEKFFSMFDQRQRYVKKNVYKDFNVLVVLKADDTLGNRSRYADSNEQLIESIETLDRDTIYARIKKVIRAMNLVTDSGDQYYAEEADPNIAAPSPDYDDTTMRQELGNGAQGTPNKTNTYSALVGPVVASRKTKDAGYVKSNDGDADNTSAAIDTLTWLTSWTKADFNSTGLTGGVIHTAGASPVGGSTLLTYWTITAFNKTADDTLKVFVNHNFLGV